MPFAEFDKCDHLKILEEWMKSYRLEELFDEKGRLVSELTDLVHTGNRRMGANPHANGGLLLKNLRLPDFRDYAIDVRKHGQVTGEPTKVMGQFLRDVMKLNEDRRNFRVIGPDEVNSNRLVALHGYPRLIHRLTYRRTNHKNLNVRGYKEEGTTTTPFDMLMQNDMDRFHLVADVIHRVPKLGYIAAYTKQAIRDKLIEHKEYITRYGQDMPEIRDWKWKYS